MTERRAGVHRTHILIAETMGLIALVAVVLRWPLTALVILPVVLYLGSRALGITLGKKALFALALSYLVLSSYPLSSGPVIKLSLWSGGQGSGNPGFAQALNFYKPLFRTTSGTWLGRSLWEYVEWWSGPMEVEW